MPKPEPIMEHDTIRTPRTEVYIEWAGRRFGPYDSLAAAQADFEVGPEPSAAGPAALAEPQKAA